MTRLLAFLFESDLPVAIQVCWKLLTLSMVVLLAVEVLPNVASVAGQVLLSVLASCFFFGGIFTKLGDE